VFNHNHILSFIPYVFVYYLRFHTCSLGISMRRGWHIICNR